MMSRSRGVAALALLSGLPGSGCKPSENSPAAEASEGPKPGAEASGVDPSVFASGVLANPPETVECTLSNGVAASCFQVQLQVGPSDHDAGPFCPRTTSDGPDVSGKRIHEGKSLDADGAFILGLAALYDDPQWKLYDESTGAVRYTATKEACAAAARPDVDEAYQNHCVECLVKDLAPGLGEQMLIPARPVPRETPGSLPRGSAVGVALNGVRFDGPAPVQAILGAHTIAAFDDCGGHVNPHAGYHYHGAGGCSASVEQADAHAPLIGYAIDGYPMHAMRDSHGEETAGLDVCRGHSDDVRGYHYHVAGPGENMFIGCLHGEAVLSDKAKGGAGGRGGRGPTACADASSTRCCGDGTCGGPETAENCSADCKG